MKVIFNVGRNDIDICYGTHGFQLPAMQFSTSLTLRHPGTFLTTFNSLTTLKLCSQMPPAAIKLFPQYFSLREYKNLSIFPITHPYCC